VSSGTDPRFRIRMEDGSEVAIPSLEALARRIDRGEILPDTQLFDVGTNAWTASRESAVVRFILEERELEGLPPVEGWEDAFQEEEENRLEGPGTEHEVEPEAKEVDEGEETQEEGRDAQGEGEDAQGEAGEEEVGSDPFALDLPLEAEASGGDGAGTSREPPSGDDPAAVEADERDQGAERDEGDEADGIAETDEKPSEFESFVLADDFVAEGEDEEEGTSEGETVADEVSAGGASHELPLLEFPDERPARGAEAPSPEARKDPGPQGSTSLDEWASGASAGPPVPGEPLPGPPVRRRPIREPRRPAGPKRQPASSRSERAAAGPEPRGGSRGTVGVLVLLGLLGAVAFFFGDRVVELWNGEAPEARAVAEPTVSGPTPRGLVGEDLTGRAEVPAVPDGFEAQVDRGLAAVRIRFDQVVDSLRAVHGISGSPPRAWLSGYYLAHASEFPGILQFWQGYAGLVGELRARDPELYLETAVRAGSGPDSNRNEAVARYLEERYRSILTLRRERYAQLILVARRAQELHDFLVLSEPDIRYTPAIGPEVPLDPILEARSERAEVQSELLRRLDALFQALDRSRGGGAPALGGLGNDLFRRFGEG